jgi:alpha-tubulin suppressor-like RCC1 family protein
VEGSSTPDEGGKGASVPHWVKGLEEQVTAVAAGAAFSAALVTGRQDGGRLRAGLWTWGVGRSGELGLGLTIQQFQNQRLNSTSAAAAEGEGGDGDVDADSCASANLPRAYQPTSFMQSCAPQRVRFPTRREWGCVHTGRGGDDSDESDPGEYGLSHGDGLNHAQGLHGHDLAGGDCRGGQLGHSEAMDSEAATLVPGLEEGMDTEPVIVSIACGPHHAAAVDTRGRLFTFGHALINPLTCPFPMPVTKNS